MSKKLSRQARWDFLFRFVVLGSAQVSAGIAGFAVMVVVSRWYGVGALGLVVLATSMFAYGTLVATLGIETHAVVEVASRRTDARQMVADVFAVRLTVSLIVHALLVLVAAILPTSREHLSLFVAYGFVLYPYALRTSWLYQAWGESHEVAATELAVQLVTLIISLILAWAGLNLIAVALARLAAETLIASVFLRNILKRLGSLPRPSPLSSLFATIRESIHLSGIQVFRGLAFASDMIILGAMATYVTSEQLGQYGAAFRIFTSSIVLVNAYFVLLLPKVAAQRNSGWRSVRRMTLSGSVLFAALSCLGFIPVAIFSDQIITALFGSGFVEAGSILRVLMIAYPFVALRQIGRVALVATKRRGFDFCLTAGGTIMHIILKVLAVWLVGYYCLPWVWLGIEVASVAALAAFLLSIRDIQTADTTEAANDRPQLKRRDPVSSVLKADE